MQGAAMPVLVLSRSEHRPPAEWAALQAKPGLKLGYVQAEGDAGALRTALREAANQGHWDAAIAAPDGLRAANAALELGLPTLVCPWLSSSEPSLSPTGLSRETSELLGSLEGSVRVPVPEVDAERWADSAAAAREDALDALIEVCRDRHDLDVQSVDLEAYAASGQVAQELHDDPLFFAAALASGAALAAAIR